MAIQRSVANAVSVAIRIGALIFFRAFPARLPSIIFSLFAIYVPAFLTSLFSPPELEVVDDQVDITVKETIITPDDEPDQELVADEVDVKETISFSEKDVPAWKIIFYGAPSSKRPFSSLLSFLINLVFVGLTADALYRARWYYPADDLSFVRLGYVSHNEANFLIREPDQAKMPVTFQIRHYNGLIWQSVGSVKATTNETDFTSVLTIPLLSYTEQQKYEWRTSNNHTGELTAAPQPGKMPTQNGGKYTFLSTSCILPRFPYNPFDHPLAVPGLRILAKKLPELSAQFMLFLGDFIYVDVPERFGRSVEEYRMQYRQVYASPDWAPVGQNLSWLHVLDDHEIENDWSANTTGVYKNAVDPWHIYQAQINPPRAVTAGTRSERRQGATWFEFVQGPASFFMLDTRSYRSSNSLPFNGTEKTMLGADQLADFLAWLARPEPKGVRWKFVASSIPFTKNWPVNVKDTWGGFLVERKKVLEAMWDVAARGIGVVVLSGDRHEFAATKFPPPPESEWPEESTVYEFSTSPLNQFASPIPSYSQVDDEDVLIHYHHSGMSKFGSFTIEEEDGESKLLYRLFISGEEKWNTTITAPPVPPEEEKKASSGSFWDRLRGW
ncbi:PhoD-like phosphatase domain-containing protein [Trichoderma novae-zelandiae]